MGKDLNRRAGGVCQGERTTPFFGLAVKELSF